MLKNWHVAWDVLPTKFQPLFWPLFFAVLGFFAGASFQWGFNDIGPFWTPLISASFWVALFTAVLAWSTIGLWVQTKRSALIAERALTDLEAPFISVKIIESGLTRSYGESWHSFGELKFSIENFGRTPARLLEIADRPYFAPRGAGQLPPKIDPAFASRNEMPWGVVAPPNGESQPFTYNLFAFTLGKVGQGEIPMRTHNFYFYGFVRYATIFGGIYRSGFCFMYDVASERWLLWGGDDYNYCKQEADAFRPPKKWRPIADSESPIPYYLRYRFHHRVAERTLKGMEEAPE